MGYPNRMKGYKFGARETKSFKMITSKGVTFNETKVPCISKYPLMAFLWLKLMRRPGCR